MENCQYVGGRFGLLWFFLVIFILFQCAKAENRTDPTDNVNLSPFRAWRGAYWCLKNVSASCPIKYILKEAGWLNVTQSDAEDFCSSGCADHTKVVLTCIYHCKRDYWFADKNHIKQINQTIDYICSNPSGFNGTSPFLRTSAGYKKKWGSAMSALPALLLVTLFYM